MVNDNDDAPSMSGTKTDGQSEIKRECNCISVVPSSAPWQRPVHNSPFSGLSAKPMVTYSSSTLWRFALIGPLKALLIVTFPCCRVPHVWQSSEFRIPTEIAQLEWAAQSEQVSEWYHINSWNNQQLGLPGRINKFTANEELVDWNSFSMNVWEKQSDCEFVQEIPSSVPPSSFDYPSGGWVGVVMSERNQTKLTFMVLESIWIVARSGSFLIRINVVNGL